MGRRKTGCLVINFCCGRNFPPAVLKKGDNMYKIAYIKTGNIFELPDETAKELKEKYPSEYKILEKNGKKFRDTIKKSLKSDDKSIYSKVVEG